MQRLVLGLLILSITQALSVARGAGEAWTPCLTRRTFALSHQNAYLEYSGLTITFFPIAPNGQVIHQTNATLAFVGVQEIWTFTGNHDGCWEPNSPLPAGAIDPDHPATPYGAFLDSLILADMECSVSYLNDTIPGTDIATESIVVNARNATSGGPTTTINITKSYGNHIEEYPGTTTTDGMIYYIKHLADAFKLSIMVDNWNWTGSDGATHLVGYMDAYIHIGSVAQMTWGAPGDLLNETILNCTTFDPSGQPDMTLSIEFDHGFLTYTQNTTDGSLSAGVPYINILPHYPVGPILWTPYDNPFGNNFSVAFCQYYPPPQYSKLLWDPQLSVLFGANFPTDQPNTGVSPVLGNKQWLPAAIVIPIVIVATAAITVIYMRTAHANKFHAKVPKPQHRSGLPA